MLAHLHAKQPAPAAYLRFVLMREFGWTPVQVRDIPLAEVLEILICMSADAEHQNRPKGRKIERPSIA